jgi:hypothetical protein
MSQKFMYVLLLLLVIIFISQSFSLILSLFVIREGLDQCLPSCDDISYDYNKNEIPPCTQMNIELLKPTDARKYGIPIIKQFETSMNNYINNNYQYTSLILPLKNKNIIIPTGISSTQNLNQIKINKYFTDFSGIGFKTNQDILDNMALDSEFNTTINEFNYSLDTDSPNSTIKQRVITNITNYKKESLSDTPGYASIYTQFLQDMSKMCLMIEQKCPGYYTENNLKTLISNEKKTPIYYGENSSFHKISEYIFSSINGTLAKTS